MTDFSNEIELAPQRATAGAEWFDEHHPGWYTRVNPDTLNIGDDCNCVVGQLFGSFSETAGRLMRQKMQVARGILVPRVNMNLHNLDRYYETITDAWRHEVQSRLAA